MWIQSCRNKSPPTTEKTAAVSSCVDEAPTRSCWENTMHHSFVLDQHLSNRLFTLTCCYLLWPEDRWVCTTRTEELANIQTRAKRVWESVKKLIFFVAAVADTQYQTCAWVQLLFLPQRTSTNFQNNSSTACHGKRNMCLSSCSLRPAHPIQSVTCSALCHFLSPWKWSNTPYQNKNIKNRT